MSALIRVPPRLAAVAASIVALAAALAAALVAAPAVARAQASPAAVDTTCAKPAFRRFDFMAGEWVVKDTAGRVMGRNSLTRAVGGCALHEHWASTLGERGESFTVFAPLSGEWHQLYVGSGGFVLNMSGGFEGDRLVLTGAPHPSRRDPAAKVIDRWSWQPLDSTHVRQVGAVSLDGGATWRPQFVAVYERAAR